MYKKHLLQHLKKIILSRNRRFRTYQVAPRVSTLSPLEKRNMESFSQAVQLPSNPSSNDAACTFSSACTRRGLTGEAVPYPASSSSLIKTSRLVKAHTNLPKRNKLIPKESDPEVHYVNQGAPPGHSTVAVGTSTQLPPSLPKLPNVYTSSEQRPCSTTPGPCVGQQTQRTRARGPREPSRDSSSLLLTHGVLEHAGLHQDVDACTRGSRTKQMFT